MNYYIHRRNQLAAKLAGINALIDGFIEQGRNYSALAQKHAKIKSDLDAVDVMIYGLDL